MIDVSSLLTNVTGNLDAIMAAMGGRPVIRGGERVFWFGSNPSPAHITTSVVRPFSADEPLILTGDKVYLWEYAKILNGGKHPPYSWQQTGSCVNSGANNTLHTRLAIDAAVGSGGAGVVTLPFTLAAYGYSRYLAFGDSSPGEGSSGDAIAKALSELGSTQYDLVGLKGVIPDPTVYPCAATYTADQEMHWSAWPNVPQSVKDASGGHKIGFVASTTLDQCEAELRKLRPISVAGNWGSTMQMAYKGAGDLRVLFGQYASTWEHQQSCHGVWHHPDFGRLWYIMNNWYMLQGSECRPVHGAPANGEPPGGYWVDDSMMQHQLSYRFGELRSYTSLVGYDQGKLSHIGV